MKSFFNLTPGRILYDEFWIEVRNRNRQLILMRYGAVLVLSFFIFSAYLLQEITPGFYIRTFPLWLVAGTILVYNIALDSLWQSMPNMKYGETKFHSLHFSLLQICLDIIATGFLVYFTGGVESPLYAIFVIVVIIAGFFLPGRFVFFLMILIFLATLAGAILEYKGILPHYNVEGILSVSLYDNSSFITLFFALFSIVLALAHYISNSIARELFLREKNLTNAYRSLEESQKAKLVYLYLLLKNIKTPIEAVKSIFSKEGQISPEEIKIAKNEVINISEFLDENYAGTGLQLETEFNEITYIDVSETLDDIHRAYSLSLMSRKINISITDKTGGQRVIYTKARLLKIALSSILSNFIQYSDEGGALAILIEDIGASINIIISNSGPAIPAGGSFSFYLENPDGKGPYSKTPRFSMSLPIAMQILDFIGAKYKLISDGGNKIEITISKKLED